MDTDERGFFTTEQPPPVVSTVEPRGSEPFKRFKRFERLQRAQRLNAFNAFNDLNESLRAVSNLSCEAFASWDALTGNMSP
jgi:hypothetical protein